MNKHFEMSLIAVEKSLQQQQDNDETLELPSGA